MSVQIHNVDRPTDAASIQRILDAAGPDDVVQFGPGTYPGPLAVRQSLTLLGQQDAQHTVIDAGRRGPALVIEGEPVAVTLCNLTLTGGAHGLGGGLSVSGMHDVTVMSCVLRDNRASDVGGGGLYASAGHVRLRDTTFSGNAAGRGGALLLDDIALVSAVNCVFTGNAAHLGGAIRLKGGVVLSLLHCTFADNRTEPRDGKPGQAAVLYASGVRRQDPRVRLSNCLVLSSEAGSLRNEPERPTRLVAVSSVLPPDWQAVAGLDDGGGVVFAQPARGERAGHPTLAAGAVGAGAGDWTLMLAGDALSDLTGTPRLADESVDPGAVESGT